MRLGYCYRQSDGDYSLTTDSECVEVLKKSLQKKIKELMNNPTKENMQKAYDLIRDWSKLDRLGEEDGTY